MSNEDFKPIQHTVVSNTPAYQELGELLALDHAYREIGGNGIYWQVTEKRSTAYILRDEVYSAIKMFTKDSKLVESIKSTLENYFANRSFGDNFPKQEAVLVAFNELSENGYSLPDSFKIKRE